MHYLKTRRFILLSVFITCYRVSEWMGLFIAHMPSLQCSADVLSCLNLFHHDVELTGRRLLFSFCSTVFKVYLTLRRLTETRQVVCLYVCLSVRCQPYIWNQSSERAIKFDGHRLGYERMHRVLVLLTLTFIQSHTDLNHENNQLFLKLFKQCPSSLL